MAEILYINPPEVKRLDSFVQVIEVDVGVESFAVRRPNERFPSIRLGWKAVCGSPVVVKNRPPGSPSRHV